ncbi:MAG: hypothetical protein HDS65_02410 [Bacteroidales bacterium]|nr:hypothetical protein [Bacteroidales bacterium]
MKKLLLTLFVFVCFGMASAWAATATFSMPELGKDIKNGTVVGPLSISPISIEFAKGDNKSTLAAWYNSGKEIRLYGGNTMTFEVAEGYRITNINFTTTSIFVSGAKADCGSFSATNKTWSDANGVSKVVITNGGTSGNTKITEIEVTYKSDLKTVENVTVTPTDLKVGDKGTFDIEAPEDFLSDVNLTFTQTTSNAVVVDAEGNYEAVGVGTDEITLSWEDGAVYEAGEYTFTVKALPAVKLEVTPEFSAVSVSSGEYGKFTLVSPENFFEGIGEYTVESDNEDVLLVDGLEFVAGLPGTATVTISWEEGDYYLSGEASFEVNVQKLPLALNFDGKTYNVGLLEGAPALNIPAGVEYTIESDNTSVAALSPIDNKALWLLSQGTANITVNTAETEMYGAATATYTLNVLPGEGAEKKVTFNFTTEDAYGMTMRSGSSSDYEEDNREFVEDVVTMLVQKNGGNGCRLWTGPQLRIMNHAIVSFSAPEGYEIQTVTFNVESNNLSTVQGVKNGQASKFTTFDFTATSRILTIDVVYTHLLSEPSDLTFNKEDRKAIAGQTVVFPAATASAENVNYIATDAEGNVTEVIVDENGYISFAADEAGEYTLTAYHEAEGELPCGIAQTTVKVEEFEQPAAYYLVGHFFDRYYDVNTPCVFEYDENENVYTLKDILIGGTEEEGDYGYIVVTNCSNIDSMGSTTEKVRRRAMAHATDWANFNEGYVYHAAGTTHAADVTSGEHFVPFTVEPGTYDFTLDATDATAPVITTTPADLTTGVENIGVEAGAEVEYYDLTGRKVANPAAGVYIRVEGGEARKVAL